ncbi:MAG: extensin family protein [Methylobacteriaceae bacterium]|nr:extensin family protein [Methylobacteriaceae bacterium]
MPPSRPPESRGAAPAATDAPVPPPRPAPEPTPPSAETVAAPPPADLDRCFGRLAELGAAAERRPPIAEGACGAADLVRVTRLPDGVALTGAADLRCPLAEALARWVKEAIRPEAESRLGRAPTALVVGTAYQCRGRNRLPNARLSEHAFANAIDLAAIELERHEQVRVAGPPNAGPSSETAFIGAVRAKACAYFTTVLGPGSDPAHADHLHLDLRQRRGGYRICQ